MSRRRFEAEDKEVSYLTAFQEFASCLDKEDISLKVESFDDFVQNVFSLGFPNFDFNTWHIRKLSYEVDELLKQKVNEPFLVAVLPRYHLKSTLLGYAGVLYRMLTSYGDGVYISYKDELANYHVSNIKNIVRDNPRLSEVIRDLSPNSDVTINYRIGVKRLRVFSSGIFGVKRGIHTDLLVVVDDILGNLENPMLLTDLEKVKRIFETEIVNIPNKGCPLFVFGTVIDTSDLLFKLKDDPNFKCIWMPALYPDPEHGVLWDTKYDKEWLQKRKGTTPSQWRAFATEFLLTPMVSADAFLTKEDLDGVIDNTLKNHSIYQPFNKEDKYIVAGFDVGKRRSPSHLSVFVSDEDDNLKMIHQSFWDGVDYIKQVELLNTAIINFDIDKLYWDATRGELEDRGLPKRVCIPIKFTGRGQRNQNSFAVDFATRVESKTVSLIDDDRFILEIARLNKNLKAVETPMGHADSFWSCALAVGAYQDYFAKNRRKGFGFLGDIQEIMGDREKKSDPFKGEFSDAFAKYKQMDICKVCNGRKFEDLPDGKRRCITCYAVW